MWKFDEYGNAINDETGEEIYSILFPDGLVRVYINSQIIGVFHNLVDAENFIKGKVEQMEG